jgi:hypothetical protein
MSATGLLPWYAGRRIGLEGRGVRSVYLFNNCKLEKIELKDNARYRGVTFHAVEQNVESSAYLHSGWA